MNFTLLSNLFTGDLIAPKYGTPLTLAVVALAIIGLAATNLGADLVLLGSLTILVASGAVSVPNAVHGFANEGLIAVAVLFIVAEGLEQTGAVGQLIQFVLGKPKTRLAALVRMIFPVAAMSSVMNNTPIVAVMLPVMDDWAKKARLSVSQLMLPLSYATILGGLCTVLGTSTTVVVNKLIETELNRQPVAAVVENADTESGGVIADVPSALNGVHSLGLFELAWVGFPCCVVGLAYILVTTKYLLPNRRPAMEQFDDPREYTVEMVVEAGSPLIGRAIDEAGLRHLPNMFLMEIERKGHILPAVSPREILAEGDRLVFVGVVESVVDLQKFAGLTPATNQVFKLDSPRSERCLIEAVVSHSCHMVGTSIREAQFRTRYNAVVIAVSRNGERISGKMGDIVLNSGDTLLLEASPNFADVQRNSRDFYLVSKVENSTPLRRERAWIAQIILVSLIVFVTIVGIDILPAAALAAAAMVCTGCVLPREARSCIDWGVLVTIGAGIGIGAAMAESGAGSFVAEQFISLGGGDRLMTLAIVYGVTMLFTNLITAKAAATLIFPVALATADKLNVSPMPFIVALMIAAAASFATPVGYQTNLMVQGPGGYRYGDYVRYGVPLSLLLWL
ncbi:MAG: SLC13 family permease, partial [Planctomycetaceae bacterium]|nr:SLC13 family permease [Planctomycetaceae bacterium]